MDVEIRRIRRLNHEPKNFISGPTLPSEEFMSNALSELNRNLLELRYNSANSTDSKVYTYYLKKNIYIILVIFNRMMVSPTYFFNSILNLLANRTCGKDEISIDEIIEIAREQLKDNINAKNIENYLLERITSVVDGKKKKNIREIHDIAIKISKQKKYNPVMDNIVSYLSEIIKPDEFTTLGNICSLISNYKCNDEDKREFVNLLVSSGTLSDYDRITIFEIKQAFEDSKRESDFAQISKDILDIVIKKLADKEVSLQDIHNAINDLTRDEIPNAIRVGLDEKKYCIPKEYSNNDIELAYNKVADVLRKLGIFLDVDLNEVSQSLDDIIMYHNLIADEIINYRLVYTYVEDLTRLLFEYLVLLTMAGENPKNDLNKYIIYESKISHPFVDTFKTIKKMNLTKEKNTIYHYIMLTLAAGSWTLKMVETGLVDVNLSISTELIDTVAVFTSMETIITFMEERFRSSFIAIVSIIASPFILLGNIIKGIRTAKKVEKRRVQEIRQAEKEAEKFDEYQKERKLMNNLVLENVTFVDDVSNDSTPIVDNEYIPGVITIIERFKTRIHSIRDSETRKYYTNKINMKIDRLNEYLRDNSKTITREMFYAYVEDQFSILEKQIAAVIAKENEERLVQEEQEKSREVMKSLELKDVNFVHRNNGKRTIAEIKEDNIILLKAVSRIEKIKSRIRSIENNETRMYFVSRMNQKIDNLNLYLITTSGTLTIARMYAYVKDQVSIINEQVKAILREEEEAREQERIRNKVKIKI